MEIIRVYKYIYIILSGEALLSGFFFLYDKWTKWCWCIMTLVNPSNLIPKPLPTTKIHKLSPIYRHHMSLWCESDGCVSQGSRLVRIPGMIFVSGFSPPTFLNLSHIHEEVPECWKVLGSYISFPAKYSQKVSPVCTCLIEMMTVGLDWLVTNTPSNIYYM